MSTMRDVAHHAGVSIATVSHVINGTRPVSDELRERVLQSMDALKYQRNTLARALRSRQSGIIGVIVPDNSNPFFAEVAQGIEDVSLEQEYSLIVCNSGNDLGRLLVHTRNLSARQADGIIFATSGDDFVVVREELRDDIPIVVIDLTTLDIPTDAVLFDNFRGGWLAARHLLELGHRRIACITGPSRQSVRRDRELGYKQALAEASVPVDTALVREGDFKPGSAYQHTLDLLRLPEPPTAIFASNDLMAMGVLRAAHELDRSVPDELSVIGFDDIELAAFTVPAITTVHIPKDEIGQAAARLLLDRIEDPERPIEKHMVEIELVVRGSTAPPALSCRPLGASQRRSPS